MISFLIIPRLLTGTSTRLPLQKPKTKDTNRLYKESVEFSYCFVDVNSMTVIGRHLRTLTIMPSSLPSKGNGWTEAGFTRMEPAPRSPRSTTKAKATKLSSLVEE